MNIISDYIHLFNIRHKSINPMANLQEFFLTYPHFELTFKIFYLPNLYYICVCNNLLIC